MTGSVAFDVDLLGDVTPAQKAAEPFYLTRESFKRWQVDALWKARAATSPKSLGRALTSNAVVEAIRKEIRRSTGQAVDTKEIDRLVRETVLRPECLN